VTIGETTHDAAACLRALWDHVSQQTKVRYSTARTAPGVMGVCLPCLPGEGTAEIFLFRDTLPVPADEPDVNTEPLVDTCRLAHEFGHLLSFRERGGRRIRADAAAQLQEEELAWEHARSLLLTLGFSEWAAFDAEREKSL